MDTGNEKDETRLPRIPQPDLVSRRTAIKTAGVAISAVAVSGSALSAQSETPVTLTPAEYATLDAVAARLIPSDANGPGAREARAARFIDRGLGGALRDALDQYRSGLAALDVFSNTAYGTGFAALSETDQDAVLEAVQDNEASGFDENSGQFFNMVRGHVIQGTFSDPFYGGNDNFVGWDMIGYPGVRTAVPAQYQQMDGEHTPNHVSVYDSTMFDEGEL